MSKQPQTVFKNSDESNFDYCNRVAANINVYTVLNDIFDLWDESDDGPASAMLMRLKSFHHGNGVRCAFVRRIREKQGVEEPGDE